MSDIVIQVENLSKEYRLGVINYGTLAKDLQSWWSRIRGKEDQNSQILNDDRKHGEDFWALKNVSFEVKAGERLGIIGRNGAGKSTLLKILSRVTTPSSGSVKIKGRVASLLEVGTGFQPELTGRENVYLNGAILGMTRAEVDKNFDEILDFSGVEDYIDTPVKRYSSGMHVRLGFAVAAHLEPDILIVDEVLAVGDIEFQKRCLSKMEDVSDNQGRTVLFVSHNMASIQKLCTSGMLLYDGEIKHISNDISPVIEDYLSGFNEAVLASYKKGEIEYAVQSDHFKVNTACVMNESGKVQTVFDYEEDIILEFEWEKFIDKTPVFPWVIIKDLSNVNIWIGVNNGEFSVPPDPGVNDIFNKGNHSCRVRIPGKILNEGEYTIDFGLNERHGYRLGCYVIDHFRVKIKRPKHISKVMGDKIPGIIHSPMAWNTAKVK